MHNSKKSPGFTLPEILVVVAILGILMTGIMMVFVTSLRTVRTGNLAMQAMELARGTVATIRHDLTTAFTARDYGKYYTFFGTPYGFSFVGLVDVGQDAKPKIGRITYVMHESSAETPSPTWTSTRWDPATSSWVDVTVTTGTLLRFAEDVDDLDSYPVNWELLTQPGDYYNPKVSSEFQAIKDRYEAYGPEIYETMLSAKKRELWIRMLAEEEDLPSAWSWRYLGKNPGDYVLAENVLMVVSNSGQEEGPYFQYGRVGFEYDAALPGHVGTGNLSDLPLVDHWNAQWNAEWNEDDDNPLNPLARFNAYGSPLGPWLPDVVRINLTFAFESPHFGAPDFVRKMDELVQIPTAYTRSKVD